MARTLKVLDEKTFIKKELITTGNYEQIWIKTDHNLMSNDATSEINERFQIKKILMKVLNRKTVCSNIQIKHKHLKKSSKVSSTKNKKLKCQLRDRERDIIYKCILLCTKCNNRSIRIAQKDCNRCNIPYICKCKACGKQINEPKDMLWHIKKECNNYKKKVYKSNNYLYKCASCSKVFNDSVNILEHIKVCEIKNLEIKSKSQKDREYHIVSISPEENDINTWKNADWKEKIVRYCLTCVKVYKAEEEMDTIAPNEKKCKNCQQLMVWKCNPCNRRFRSYTGVFHHLEEYCSYGTLLECNKCKFKTVNSEYLKTHVELIHSDKDLLECKKCNKKFKDLEHLNMHYKICGEVKNLQCKHCLKKFHLREMLEIHLKISHGLIEFNFIDHIYILDDEKNITAKDQLNDKKLYNLDTNSYGKTDGNKNKHSTYDFISSINLNLNKNLVNFATDSTICNFECTTCRSKFKNEDFYELHLKYCEVEPVIQCEYCTCKCYSETDLKKHIILIHPDKVTANEAIKTDVKKNKSEKVINAIKVKPISEVISGYCLTCNDARKTHNRFKKCFKCKSVLLFCCVKCDSSSSCYHLDQYLQTLLYECDHCSKGFPSEIAVTNHKNYFHNYSRYECPYCGLQAALKETVDKHISWCLAQDSKNNS